MILDLWIPPGDLHLPEMRDFVPGPKIGLHVLKKLLEKLGPAWPIFIVSGNLTRSVREKLVAMNIPSVRVFSKPLNEKAELLVEGVQELLKTSGPSPAEAGTPPTAGLTGEGL